VPDLSFVRPAFLAAFFLIAACNDTLDASKRLCKPVVPEIVIDWKTSSETAEKRRLILTYNEGGVIPGKDAAARGNARHSVCATKGSTCIAERARFEIRTEPERRQSIKILELNGVTDIPNPTIGNIQWTGPSYPDRVLITCDADKVSGSDACALDRLEYVPDRDGENSHDQCSPLF